MHEIIILIAKYFVVIPVFAWMYILFRMAKQQRLEFIVFTAVSAILTLVLVKLGTTLHQDPRPFIRDHVHPYFSSSTDNGFPSDHEAFSATLAFVVLRFRRSWGVLLLIVALLIGLTRVISGVHHAQDIIGGLLFAGLGVAAAWPVSGLLRKHLDR